jgi:hypothetical protein
MNFIKRYEKDKNTLQNSENSAQISFTYTHTQLPVLKKLFHYM